MHARALHVLHDAGDEDVPAVTDGVHLDLAADDVLVDQHGLLFVDAYGGLKIPAQRLLVGYDLHRAPPQHIARAHEHGIADALGRAHAVGDVRHGLAVRLRDLQLQQELFKAVAVFGALDRVGLRADHFHAALHQRLDEIDGGLAAERRDHAERLFQLDDVHHVLDRERLEVELIRAGIVRGHGLGVVVDDDGLVARLADRLDRVNGGVVEFHALPDADRAGAEDKDLFALGDNGLVLLLVGGVEVGDVAFKLARAGVDHLVHGADVLRAPRVGDRLFRALPEVREVVVGEAHALGLQQGVGVERRVLDGALELDDVVELVEEEHVDAREVADTVVVHAQPHELRDGEDTVIRADLDVFHQLFNRHVVELRHVDVAHTDLQRADGLEEALLDRAAHAHHFTCGLHLCAELVRRASELVKREARHLRHDVVERRLEGGGSVRDHDLVERHADGDLGRDACDRVAAGLGGQRRGARDAGVDLDEVVLEALGIERKLHVAAALDLKRADQAQRAVAQHVVFAVRERLARRDDDAVARVDADGVEVLHVADGDGGVTRVAHDLVFNFLVALDALFHEHLMHGGEGQGVLGEGAQLLVVVGKAAACAAQREGGTQHDGIADLARGAAALVNVCCDHAREHRLAQRFAELFEFLAVLRAGDALRTGAQDFDLTLVQNAGLIELRHKVQPRLTAEAGNDGVRTLIADDAANVFGRERLHIDLVRDGGVGHDRGGVGVCKHNFISLFAERKTGLRAGVVELGGLSDHDRAGADDENLVDIGAFRHGLTPPFRRARPCSLRAGQ